MTKILWPCLFAWIFLFPTAPIQSQSTFGLLVGIQNEFQNFRPSGPDSYPFAILSEPINLHYRGGHVGGFLLRPISEKLKLSIESRVSYGTYKENGAIELGFFNLVVPIGLRFNLIQSLSLDFGIHAKFNLISFDRILDVYGVAKFKLNKGMSYGPYLGMNYDFGEKFGVSISYSQGIRSTLIDPSMSVASAAYHNIINLSFHFSLN